MAKTSFSLAGDSRQSKSVGIGLPVNAIRGRLENRKYSVVLGAVACFVMILALLVPLLPLQDPVAMDLNHSLAAPSTTHWLGTDLLGHDELSRVLWASRTSLAVGIVATALAVACGIMVGGLAGYGGRLADATAMRTADIFLSFPFVLGAIAIMAIFGPGRRNVFLAIAFFGWPVIARVFRASVLSVKQQPFVLAAEALGASRQRVFLRHVLPNAAGPLISYSSLLVAAAITAEAGLSYIGLGVQPPEASWGLMLADSAGQFEQAPWLLIVPGVALTLTVLIFILIGASAGKSMAIASRSSKRKYNP